MKRKNFNLYISFFSLTIQITIARNEQKIQNEEAENEKNYYRLRVFCWWYGFSIYTINHAQQYFLFFFFLKVVLAMRLK